MKLTIIIITAFLMQVSASGFAQRITIKNNNITLKQAFIEIRKQTGFIVLYESDVLNKIKPVKLNLVNFPLEDALKVMLDGQNLEFSIKEKSIVIKEKERRADLPAISQPEMASALPVPILIRGIVSDENGKPMTGVSVKALANTNGLSLSVVTDVNGRYMIGTQIGTTLVFSFVGYKKLEIKVGEKRIIDVKMIPDMSDLDDIQVIAYGSVSKRFQTGDVTTVKGDDLAKQPVSNLLQALSGLVPGMNITQANGNPGSNSTVQIRGQNSILNGGSPLFIVDGVPYPSSALNQLSGGTTTALTSSTSSAAGELGLSPLNSLNIGDIESVEVLKDADATAIYGSRGSNGVILITTKKGRAGKTRINFQNYTGINKLSRVQEFMNTSEYLTMRRQALKNDGLTPGVNDLDLNGTWDTTRYTNWAKELIGRPSRTSNSQLSISGGSEQTQFRIGAGYNVVTPPYEGDFSSKRTSLQFSINNTSSDKKFNMLFSGAYSINENNLPGFDISSYINLPPHLPALKNPDGSLIWPNYLGSPAISNPYAQLIPTYRATTKSLTGNAQISYQIISGLQVKTHFGYTNTAMAEKRTLPSTAIGANAIAQGKLPSASWGNSGVDTWIAEPQLEYKYDNDHSHVNILVGSTLQNSLNEGRSNYGSGFSNDALLDNESAATIVQVSNNYSQYRYLAFFGRINYILNNRYMLNLTGRRDGSSRFGPDKKFANFGAIGAGWIFSEENLIKKNLPFLSFGKLRGSYGITGNDQIADYRYLNSYSSFPNYSYLGVNGLASTRLFNPDFGWESNKKLEGALELGFIKDRILLTTTWYRNVSSNQLVTQPLAPTTGNASVQANLPAVVENTGWEFELTSTNVKSKAFNWKSLFSISFSANKLLAFPDLEKSSYANTYIIGQPVRITKVYQFMGVNPTTGLYEFMTAKGTITSAPNANTDQIAIVTTTPKFFGAFQNSFQYKNWQLSALLRFVKQTGANQIYNRSAAISSTQPGGIGNLPVYFLGRVWEKPGDISEIQKYSNSTLTRTAAAAVQRSTIAYTDASYIRCQNVSMSYHFDSAMIKKIGLSDASLSFSGQNLFTITNYLGSDPESQGAVLPPLKTFTLGLSITF